MNVEVGIWHLASGIKQPFWKRYCPLLGYLQGLPRNIL
jgi:hypothetical protein